jgi:hypothetical protein
VKITGLWAAVVGLAIVFPAVPVQAVTARCPGGRMVLEGSSQMPGGGSLWQRREWRRISPGPGTDGQWDLIRVDQVIITPVPSPYPWARTMTIPTGSGRTMTCVHRSQGTRQHTVCTGGSVIVRVRNGVYRVRWGAGAPGVYWEGRITGDQVVCRLHPPQAWAPVLRGTVSSGGTTASRISLAITSPRQKHNYVFNAQKPGVFKMTLQARVSPRKHAGRVRWTIPVIQGSRRIVRPSSARGARVEVTYTGLPADNAAYGPKTVQATLDVGGCRAEDRREVRFFYPATAQNNPGGRYPNWFYYWRQTPAARPHGQRVNIEYGGRTFDRCRDKIVPALFKPGYAYKTLHVCDLSRIKFKLVYPLLNRLTPQKYFGTRTVWYIDTFALAVLHEYFHQRCYQAWRAGKSPGAIAQQDRDDDGIPDHLEQSFKFDPRKFQTYLPQKLSRVGGDEEWLAYEEMGRYQIGSYDRYDWASPGKNWKPNP